MNAEAAHLKHLLDGASALLADLDGVGFPVAPVDPTERLGTVYAPRYVCCFVVEEAGQASLFPWVVHPAAKTVGLVSPRALAHVVIHKLLAQPVVAILAFDGAPEAELQLYAVFLRRGDGKALVLEPEQEMKVVFFRAFSPLVARLPQVAVQASAGEAITSGSL